VPREAEGRSVNPNWDVLGIDYIPPSTSVIMERCFGAETTDEVALSAAARSAEQRKARRPWHLFGDAAFENRMPRDH
jgi:hypothetical protein